MSAYNPHQEAARMRKAIALIEEIRTRVPGAPDSLLAEAASLMDETLWHDIACLANVHPPSPETITLIVKYLETSEPPAADLFEGL